MLREVSVVRDFGTTGGAICRSFGISEQSYYLYGRLSRCKSILN